MTDEERKILLDRLLDVRLSKEEEIEEEPIRKIFYLSYEKTFSKTVKESDFTFDQDRIFALATLLDYCIGEYTFFKRKYPEETEIPYDSLAKKAYTKYTLLKDSDMTSNNQSVSTNYYSPEISTMRALELYLLRINEPLSHTNPKVSLVNDIFQTVFRKVGGYCKMMTLGLFADAFVSWRTLHESECILTLLVHGGDKTRFSYVDHIAYNNALRNQADTVNFPPEVLDVIFAEIKEKMRQHNLKSKDMKKFIEYGWIYDYPTFDLNDPTLKLNFRDGVERLAGLSKYSKIYEFASEIAHSSSVFFYVNDDICRDFSLTLVYQSFVRICHNYLKYMENFFKANPKSYDNTVKLLNQVEAMSTYLFDHSMVKEAIE